METTKERRRRARHSDVTILGALRLVELTGNVTGAARRAGVPEQTVRCWAKGRTKRVRRLLGAAAAAPETARVDGRRKLVHVK